MIMSYLVLFVNVEPQRLVIDPNSNNILFFGARSGNGLWKSTDFGATWTQVKSFPSVGEYALSHVASGVILTHSHRHVYRRSL